MRLTDCDSGVKNIELSPILIFRLLWLSPNLKSDFHIIEVEFTLSLFVWCPCLYY